MAYFPNIQLVLLVLVALAHQLCGIKVAKDIIHGTRAWRILYESGSSDGYDELIDTYIDLASSGRTLYGLPVHPVQTKADKPPPWWVPIDIVGRDKHTDRTSLLIRADNGYLVGFTNWSGLLDGPGKNLIPRATLLDTGVEYKDLFGPGECANVPKLPLSEDLFVDGAHVLGTYPASSREEMQIAVGRFAVMIPEAARLKPIRQLISDNWNVGECRVDLETAKHIVKWGTMSLLLFCADRGIALTGSDAKELSQVATSTAEGVKNFLGIVLVPTRFDPNNAAKSCTPPVKTAEQKRKRNQKKKERKKRKREQQGQGQAHQGSGSVPH